MAAISQRDYEAVLACIGRLHECEDLEQFPRVALAEILKLVGADYITFNYLAPTVPKVFVVSSPEVPSHAQREEVFAQYLSDQPIVRNYLSTGDATAHALSDFLSVREYHGLPIYKQLYHDLCYEDQLAIMLFPPGSEMVAIALARDRRSFTERDRRILNLLRPHLARAYRHVEKLTLLNRALHQQAQMSPATQVSSLLLDAEDHPVHFGKEAQQWIARFFPERPRNSSRLPDAITTWLRHRRNTVPGRPDSLVQERDGQRLRLRIIPAASGDGHILVLGLETAADAARSALASTLTRREVDVLLQVEQGKTNDEVGAALGISSLTVRTHLEHIFDKLRVPSRTAAVTHFRRLCGRVSQKSEVGSRSSDL